MTFQFTPPNNPSTPAAAAAPSGFQPSPAAALAAATAAPAVNIEQAIAASMVGASQVADRNPELPPGGQYDLKIHDLRASVDRQTGLGYYIDVVVNASTGVAVPPGTICTAKIRGFNNPDSVNFAIRDIRSFTKAALKNVDMSNARALFADATDIATWTGKGVPTGWIGDDQRWAQLISAMVLGKPCLGQQIFCKSASASSTKVQGRKAKTVYEWFSP